MSTAPEGIGYLHPGTHRHPVPISSCGKDKFLKCNSLI